MNKGNDSKADFGRDSNSIENSDKDIEKTLGNFNAEQKPKNDYNIEAEKKTVIQETKKQVNNEAGITKENDTAADVKRAEKVNKDKAGRKETDDKLSEEKRTVMDEAKKTVGGEKSGQKAADKTAGKKLSEKKSADKTAGEKKSSKKAAKQASGKTADVKETGEKAAGKTAGGKKSAKKAVKQASEKTADVKETGEKAAGKTAGGKKPAKKAVKQASEKVAEVNETGKQAAGKTATDDITDEKASSGNAAVEKSVEVNSAEDNSSDQTTDVNHSSAGQADGEVNLPPVKVSWRKRLLTIKSGVALTLLCLVGFAFFLGCTAPGNMLLLRMGVNLGGTIWDSMTNNFDNSKPVSADVDIKDDEDVLPTDAPEVDLSTIKWPSHSGTGRHEDGVYNILLLGEEAIHMGNGRGHTDVMVIATLNTNNKTVKLTSLMRDMLVQIPGYKENKLNIAYAEGGLDLLYKTIALNFNIQLDGCVKVNFQNFEKIVDDLGGLNLTLKENEAYYLNHTNYISNPKYRTLVAGTQHMNGNQVLGYARVRKTSTITGNNNDYGRTDRHRAVLNAIYEKCRTKSKAELVCLMLKFLPMITTDIDSQCFQALLNSYFDMGMSSAKIQQLRIPVNGTFQDNLKVRGMSVIILDFDKNIKALQSFIFGDDTSDSTTGSSSNSSSGSTGSSSGSTAASSSSGTSGN